jgi:hypothetical protein
MCPGARSARGVFGNGTPVVVLGRKDGVAVLFGPAAEHADRLEDGLPEVGERVLDPRGDLGEHLASHQPVVLKPAKGLGEHLGADAADECPELAVAARSVAQGVDRHDGPFVGDDLDGEPGGTVGEKYIARPVKGTHGNQGTYWFLSDLYRGNPYTAYDRPHGYGRLHQGDTHHARSRRPPHWRA